MLFKIKDSNKNMLPYIKMFLNFGTYTQSQLISFEKKGTSNIKRSNNIKHIYENNKEMG